MNGRRADLARRMPPATRNPFLGDMPGRVAPMKMAMRVIVGISSLAVPIILAAYHTAVARRLRVRDTIPHGVAPGLWRAVHVGGVRRRGSVARSSLQAGDPRAPRSATAVPLGHRLDLLRRLRPPDPRFIVVATPMCLFVIFFACSVGNVLITNRSESHRSRHRGARRRRASHIRALGPRFAGEAVHRGRNARHRRRSRRSTRVCFSSGSPTVRRI